MNSPSFMRRQTPLCKEERYSMSTDWMGRYRPLVAALVRHSNITQRIAGTRSPLAGGMQLSSQEWQVFEYILEHQNDDAHMNRISERLGIPQSSFSKIVKTLCGYGLVDKYQLAGNRKNIILRPSAKGCSVYSAHSSQVMAETFACFFDALDSLDDEDIAQFAKALDRLNQRLLQGDAPPKPPRLIPK